MYGCDVIKSSVLDWLAPTLRAWGHMVKEYCAAHDDDAPYWYNERANVGMLHAAAWASGCVGVEEYSSVKEDADGNEWQGRRDLYILNRAAGKAACVEAKQGWVTPGVAETTITNVMDSATRDAHTIQRGIYRAAATFYTVKLPPGSDEEAERGRLLARLRSMKPNIHLLAWSFPAEMAGKVSADRWGKEWLWPGVAVAIRHAWKNPDK